MKTYGDYVIIENAPFDSDAVNDAIREAFIDVLDEMLKVTGLKNVTEIQPVIKSAAYWSTVPGKTPAGMTVGCKVRVKE